MFGDLGPIFGLFENIFNLFEALLSKIKEFCTFNNDIRFMNA